MNSSSQGSGVGVCEEQCAVGVVLRLQDGALRVFLGGAVDSCVAGGLPQFFRPRLNCWSYEVVGEGARRARRSCHGASDDERATDLAMRVNGSEEAAEAYLNWLAIVACDEVDTFWDVVERVARELFERRTLSAAEIAACCRERV